MEATVTAKGQVTVPRAIREQSGIVPGTRLDFRVEADGTLRVKVLARGAGTLFGLLRKPGEPARTLEEMDEGVTAAQTSRHLPPRT